MNKAFVVGFEKVAANMKSYLAGLGAIPKIVGNGISGSSNVARKAVANTKKSFQAQGVNKVPELRKAQQSADTIKELSHITNHPSVKPITDSMKTYDPHKGGW